MSDPNMITAYSWAAGLFQQVLPLSLVDIEKRAKLVNEINTSLVKAKNGQDKMLIDLGATEKDRRLDEIAQLSIPYLTEQIDDALRKNILVRLWTGCMEAAKAIRFTSVAGIRNGEVIQAPIMTEDRQSLFNLIDLSSKTPAYKKVVKEYYSLSGVPSNSIVINYTNEYEKE
ncbi:MAG: hypothetical protein WCC17_09130 [Candidatus Nitrosopolaris sp.]